MLDIKASSYVVEGKHRACYIHPHNESLCVKILLPSKTGGSQKEANRETKYYRFLEKKNVPWTMLPKFYGEVITSLGKGYIFDLVRDYDGNISRNLTHYLSDQQLTQNHAQALSVAFDLLNEYLLQWKIITLNIQARNLVFKKISSDEGRLVIVDDVGNTEFIPVSNYIDFMATMKIKRKWQRFVSLLLKAYPDNKFLKSKFLVKN
jgi:hypothetical protein